MISKLDGYKVLLCSDVGRDGMYLDVSGPDGAAAEVFYSDISGEMMVTLYAPLPIDVVEHLLSEARRCLPPDARRKNGSLFFPDGSENN